MSIQTIRILVNNVAPLNGRDEIPPMSELGQQPASTTGGVIEVETEDIFGLFDPGQFTNQRNQNFIVTSVLVMSAGKTQGAPFPSGSIVGLESPRAVGGGAGSGRGQTLFDLETVADGRGIILKANALVPPDHKLQFDGPAAGPHLIQLTLVPVQDTYIQQLGSSGEGGLTPHAIGGSSHTSSSLAQVNSKINDADLDAAGTPRPPTSHAFAGDDHSQSSLAQVNSKISDANLDAAGTSRPPTSHASSHIKDGSDAIPVESLGTAATDTALVLKPDGSGGTAFGAAPGGGNLSSQDFGGYIETPPLYFRKGICADSAAGEPDRNQLTCWVPPVGVTLKHLEVVSFRAAAGFTIDPVIEIFLGASATPSVTVTLDNMVDLPDEGSHQNVSLGDFAVPAGSVVTMRQASGTGVQFAGATIYWT